MPNGLRRTLCVGHVHLHLGDQRAFGMLTRSVFGFDEFNNGPGDIRVWGESTSPIRNIHAILLGMMGRHEIHDDA